MKKSLSLFLAVMLAFTFCNFGAVFVQAADGDTYTLIATIRDFDPVNDRYPERRHSDFENPNYFNTSSTGAVKSDLGEDNTPVYADSGYTTEIITNAESFYDWYHDTSKNINILYDMVFKKSGDYYVFDSTGMEGFFPINGQGFGNYQNNKNYHFTLELHTKFIYRSGQTFEIAGDDDLWVFVNKKLVGDLGGIHETQSKTIELDDYAEKLGLTSGEVYSLDVFFAERHVTESNLKISTNIILETNRIPKADAGKDQNKKTDDSKAKVTLDASGSSDPDGDSLTYTWTDKDGNKIAEGVKPEVELPVGENTLTLTVSDGTLTDTDTVVITIGQNSAPKADAGKDQNKKTDDSKAKVTLDASGSSDPDGDSLTYTWTDKDGKKIAEGVKPEVELLAGENTLTLTVSDGTLTDTDTVVITIGQNSAPKADAGKDQNKKTDDSKAKVTLDASGSSDPDGDSLTYTWMDKDGKKIAEGVKPEVELSAGENTLTLTVSDGTLTDTDTVVITIAQNRKPVADAGDEQTKRTDGKSAKVTLDGSDSSDPDGDSLTYTWMDKDGKKIAEGVKPGIDLPVGDHEITLTVSDGSLTDKDTVVIKVKKSQTTVSSPSGGSSTSSALRNKPPKADAGLNQVIFTSEDKAEATLDGSKSSDPDGDSLTYTWKDESNKTIGNDVKPTVELPVGANEITLTVSDGKASSTDTVIITIGKEHIPSATGADIAIFLIADKSRVEENKNITFTMRYVNKTYIKAMDSYIEFELPDNIQVVDVAGGQKSENKIIWELGDLDSRKEGEIRFTVQPGKIDSAEIVKDFVSTIRSRGAELTNTYDDTSKLGIMVYSNRFDNVHKRYILGYPDGTFMGERNITRAETAVIFARILDLKDLNVTGKNKFVDVRADHWAIDHIYAAVQIGLFKGVDSTHFNPDVPITRAELATVIANYLKVSRTAEQKSFEITFNDVLNHWAQGNIEEIARYNIVKGYEDGSFRPENKITRQEAVVMINNLLHRGPLTNASNSFPDMVKGHWAFEHVEEAVRSHEFNIDSDNKEVMTKFIDDSIW